MKKIYAGFIALLLMSVIIISGCIEENPESKKISVVKTDAPVKIAEPISTVAEISKPVMTQASGKKEISSAVAVEEKSISIAGIVKKEGFPDPFGHSGEGSYYQVTVILSNKGKTAVTINLLEGVFYSGGELQRIFLTPDETYKVLEPGRSVDFLFSTIGITNELVKAFQKTGKRIVFGVKIFSEESNIGPYGAPMPSPENLSRDESPLIFTKLK